MTHSETPAVWLHLVSIYLKDVIGTAPQQLTLFCTLRPGGPSGERPWFGHPWP